MFSGINGEVGMVNLTAYLGLLNRFAEHPLHDLFGRPDAVGMIGLRPAVFSISTADKHFGVQRCNPTIDRLSECVLELGGSRSFSFCASLAISGRSMSRPSQTLLGCELMPRHFVRACERL